MGKKRKKNSRAKRSGKKVKQPSKKKQKTPVGRRAKRKVKKARKKSRAEKDPRSAVAMTEMVVHGIDTGIAGLGAFDVEKGLVSMPYRDAFTFAENYKAGSLYLHEQMAASTRAAVTGISSPALGDGVVGLTETSPVAADTHRSMTEALSTAIDMGESVADGRLLDGQRTLSILDAPESSRYLGSAVTYKDLLSDVGRYAAGPETGAYDFQVGLGACVDTSRPLLGQALFDGRASYQVAGIDDFMASLDSEVSIGTSPALDLIRDANRTVAGIIQESVSIDCIMPECGLLTGPWGSKFGLKEEETRLIDTSREGFIAAPAYHTHLARVSELTVFAQESVASFTHDDLGLILGLGPAVRGDLATGFVDQSREYGTFLKSIAESPTKLFSLTPEAAVLPSLSFDSAAALMESISVPEESLRTDDWIWRSREEAAAVTADEVEEALSVIAPELLDRLRGGRQALVGTNPDRVRHYYASMRELINALLRERAPDDAIRSWSTDPDLYHENRPIRKARVLYICRDLRNVAYSEYADTDIEKAIRTIKNLQGGVHCPLEYTEAQIQRLEARVESALRLVLWDMTGDN